MAHDGQEESWNLSEKKGKVGVKLKNVMFKSKCLTQQMFKGVVFFWI